MRCAAVDPRHFVYVHVPFCMKKCPYCDFYSLPSGDDARRRVSRWFHTVSREMLLWRDVGDLAADVPIATVYIGGGTPSLVDGPTLHTFLCFVRDEFTLQPDAEITLEMQPDTAATDDIESFAQAGITRFSVGVQSFHDPILRLACRRHDAAQARAMLRACSAAGRLSLDLISCWPGQTTPMWMADLGEALTFHPVHISAYELTLHRDTEFERAVARGNYTSPDEETRLAMYEQTVRALTGAGFEQYEVSNYARPGERSRHNENYWRLGDYTGMGAGAHSFVWPNRYVNADDVAGYESAIAAGQLFRTVSNASDPVVFALENLQMGLRLLEGVDLDDFRVRFAFDVRTERCRALEDLQEAGLVELRGSRLALTHAGRVRADSVIAYLA